MSTRQHKDNAPFVQRLMRRARRAVATVAFGLFVASVALPPASPAQAFALHRVMRPMDGSGDSPLMP